MPRKRSDKEQVHLYIREAETGKFVTHFLYPKKEWEYFEALAAFHNRTTEEEFKAAILEYAEKVKNIARIG